MQFIYVFIALTASKMRFTVILNQQCRGLRSETWKKEIKEARQIFIAN